VPVPEVPIPVPLVPPPVPVPLPVRVPLVLPVPVPLVPVPVPLVPYEPLPLIVPLVPVRDPAVLPEVPLRVFMPPPVPDVPEVLYDPLPDDPLMSSSLFLSQPATVIAPRVSEAAAARVSNLRMMVLSSYGDGEIGVAPMVRGPRGRAAVGTAKNAPVAAGAITTSAKPQARGRCSADIDGIARGLATGLRVSLSRLSHDRDSPRGEHATGLYVTPARASRRGSGSSL
jgi:hypothetical protein